MVQQVVQQQLSSSPSMPPQFGHTSPQAALQFPFGQTMGQCFDQQQPGQQQQFQQWQHFQQPPPFYGQEQQFQDFPSPRPVPSSQMPSQQCQPQSLSPSSLLQPVFGPGQPPQITELEPVRVQFHSQALDQAQHFTANSAAGPFGGDHQMLSEQFASNPAAMAAFPTMLDFVPSANFTAFPSPLAPQMAAFPELYSLMDYGQCCPAMMANGLYPFGGVDQQQQNCQTALGPFEQGLMGQLVGFEPIGQLGSEEEMPKMGANFGPNGLLKREMADFQSRQQHFGQLLAQPQPQSGHRPSLCSSSSASPSSSSSANSSASGSSSSSRSASLSSSNLEEFDTTGLSSLGQANGLLPPEMSAKVFCPPSAINPKSARRTPRRSRLELSHKRVHFCTIGDCDKVYTKSSHLKAHQRLHTGPGQKMEKNDVANNNKLAEEQQRNKDEAVVKFRELIGSLFDEEEIKEKGDKWQRKMAKQQQLLAPVRLMYAREFMLFIAGSPYASLPPKNMPELVLHLGDIVAKFPCKFQPA